MLSGFFHVPEPHKSLRRARILLCHMSDSRFESRHLPTQLPLMSTRTLLGSLFSLILTLAVTNTASAQGENEFTTSAEKKGKVTSTGDDWIVVELPGLAGYKVLFKEDGGRGWLDLSYGGKSTELISDIHGACPGTWPNKANDVVQWRGIRAKGKFMPYAMIFRMQSTVDEATGKKAETLIVIKLNGAASKVVGSVPSNKGGNAAAEALADKLCGPK
jgi:hypothetical protein